MKVTESKKVIDIVRPPIKGMPEAPSVAVSMLLIHAVERMLEKNITSIAVQSRGRVVGYIRLSDALQSLGLTL
jgi:CBS domain-containing protein